MGDGNPPFEDPEFQLIGEKFPREYMSRNYR